MKILLYLKYTVLFSAALFISSCSKDLGNYSYQDINEVNFGKIEDSYTVLLGAHLNINPELHFTQPGQSQETDYSYEWFAINNNVNTLPGDKRKNLATTKKLDIDVQIPPGLYTVHYKVTDKKTGVSFTRQFSLKVETIIYEGWMVLNDIQNTGRLDMISMINNQFTPLHDILKTSGSQFQLKGKPLDVYCYPFMRNDYGIYISTDQGTNRINPESFAWKDTYNLKTEVLGKVDEKFHADFFSATPEEPGVSYMYSQGNVYYYFGVFQIFYGIPINIAYGEAIPFRAAPFIPAVRNFGAYPSSAVLFDMDKKRFLQHGNRTSYVLPFAKSNSTLFDFDNVGMDLEYMTYSTYNAGDVFAVLKNNNGKRYLARFNCISGTQSYFEEIKAQDIDKATNYAVSPVFGYLFYSVGGKVYEYDLSLKTSKLMLDKGSEQISLLKFQYFTDTWPEKPAYTELAKQLIVASYNPAGLPTSNGKIEFFNVQGLNGPLKLVNKFEGFGKVVSISYRER